MPTIDISGPAGNAFALMGQAKMWARQLNYSAEQTDAIIEDMQSGDYEHLKDALAAGFPGVDIDFYTGEADDEDYEW